MKEFYLELVKNAEEDLEIALIGYQQKVVNVATALLSCDVESMGEKIKKLACMKESIDRHKRAVENAKKDYDEYVAKEGANA